MVTRKVVPKVFISSAAVTVLIGAFHRHLLDFLDPIFPHHYCNYPPEVTIGCYEHSLPAIIIVYGLLWASVVVALVTGVYALVLWIRHRRRQ